jgi:Ni/Co efflux regulator RcnB
MLKKIIVAAALSIQFVAVPLAQAQASAPAAPTTTHKANRDKVRACTVEATSRQLLGDEFRAFVAQCVKADAAPK